MRKLFINVITIALCLSLALAPSAAFAAPAGAYVQDNYGVLDATQASQLEAQAESVAAQYQIGMYYVTVDDIGTQSARNYAISYYQNNGLGVGSMRSGVMLLVAVESRDYITITYGDGGGSSQVGSAGAVDAFSDDRLDTIESDVVSYLRYSDWSGAAEAFFDDSEDTIAYLFANGEPMQNSSAYHNVGYSSEEDDEFDGILGLIVRILGILGVPAIVAQGVVSGEKRAMRNAEQRHEANFYLDSSSLQLTKSNDQFINTTMAVVPLAQLAHDDHDGGSFGGGFGGFGNSSVGGGGFGGGHGGKF